MTPITTEIVSHGLDVLGTHDNHSDGELRNFGGDDYHDNRSYNGSNNNGFGGYHEEEAEYDHDGHYGRRNSLVPGDLDGFKEEEILLQ
jgi:hypothetical protein